VSDEELIAALEPEQLVADTSRPVARRRLTPRSSAAMWALLAFAIVLSAMVLYAFVAQLQG